MEKFLFPPYIPPDGGPHYWRTETSGLLPNAIKAYLANRTENAPISTNDCDLVKAYLRHWVNAPVWERLPLPGPEALDKAHKKHLIRLRDAAACLTDADSIAEWLHVALDFGIDPL